MADQEEKLKALETQLKDAKAKKAPAAETKALNDQIVALRKDIGQAKKASKPKDEDEGEEGGVPAAAKPAAKAEKPAAAKATPAKPADKPADKAADKPAATPAATPADKPAATPAADAGEGAKKPAAKKAGGAAAATKPAAKDAASAAAEAPKADAPKEAPKTETAAPKKAAERKKSEKQDVATPKDPERKKSEKTTDADVDKLAEGVKGVDLKAKAKKGAETKPAAKVETAEASKAEHKDEAVTVHTTPSSGSRKLKIVGISGSLRAASWNTGIIRYAAKNAPANVEFVHIEIKGLPLFNQDNESKADQEVSAFKNAIASADGVFIATPEYNYSTTGVLKNAIDVGSRPYGQSCWDGKPVGLASATYSAGGGIRAQTALRQSFVFLNTPVPPGGEVLIGNAHTKFDADGNLIDADSQAHVKKYLENFAKFILRVQAGHASVP